MDPIGLVCAAVAVLCFGSNFVVVRAYKSGDGLFFQYIMCTAIFIAGLVTYLIQCTTWSDGCPKFEPLAMLGGVVWACGNVWVVPIVKAIGLSSGILIWGTVNMLMGWASGRFGLFGLTADPIADPTLNSIGVMFAVLALGVYVGLKPEVIPVGGAKRAAKAAGRGGDDDDTDSAYAGLLYKEAELGLKPGAGALNASVVDDDAGAGADGDDETMWVDRLPAAQKKTFGVAMSVASGLLYGCNFDPPSYIVDHPDKFPGAATDLSAYVFPHFCGIFLTSVAFVQGYALFTKNNPVVFPKIILPGFISGLMWAVAQICWFQANSRLALSIAFPLISIGPGLVGAAWGVFVFGELKGTRNYLLLGVAFLLTGASAACTVLSKS